MRGQPHQHGPEGIRHPVGVFDRILLKARVRGPDGNNIAHGATADASATVIMTAIGTSLCCAAIANTPVTADNPRHSGEMIYVYATGQGSRAHRWQ